MREKYRAISSGVGDCRRRFCAVVAVCEYAYAVSESELWRMVVAAAGVEE